MATSVLAWKWVRLDATIPHEVENRLREIEAAWVRDKFENLLEIERELGGQYVLQSEQTPQRLEDLQLLMDKFTKQKILAIPE